MSTPWPIRILAAIPRGSDPTLALDADGEKAVIAQALAGMEDKVEVTYLDELYEDRRVTWQRIHERLRERAKLPVPEG